MKVLEAWKHRARALSTEIYAIQLAYKDPRVPWYARLFALCVVGYAISPIDLIPDPIPVLGYLDDLILLPIGIVIALRMIPPTVLDECRDKARQSVGRRKPRNWVVAGIIIALWLLLFGLTAIFIARLLLCCL